MQYVQCKGYVLSKEIRYCFLIGGFIGILSIAAFSCFMWYVAFTQTHSQDAPGQIALIFMLLAVLLAFLWERNIKIANMRYVLDNEHVSNLCGSKVKKLELTTCSIIKEVAIQFTFAKGRIDIPFWIITNKTCPPQVLTGNGGLKELRTLWEYGVIILPSNNDIAKNLCADDRNANETHIQRSLASF